MIFNTNKQKGNAGLGIAIAYYSSNRSTLNICEKYHKYRVDFFDNGTITLKKIAKGIGPFGKK